MNKQFENNKTTLDFHSNKIQEMQKKHIKEVDESKQELLDEILRLRKERSDIQMLAASVKERALQVNENLEKTLEEVAKLQSWSGRVKEILALSTMIEIQEE